MLKQLARAASLALVLPCALACLLGQALLGRERGFAGWSQLLSLLPGFIGVYLRWAFYRLTLLGCGADTWISFGAIFSHPQACLGKTVYIGPYSSLGAVTLEDDVLIGSHVSIANGANQHGTERLDIPIREQPGTWPRITIGRDTWIGDRAVVLADVGRQCVIGAGAVVTHPIPDYAVAVGVPAKIVRWRKAPEPSARGQRQRAAGAMNVDQTTEQNACPDCAQANRSSYSSTSRGLTTPG